MPTDQTIIQDQLANQNQSNNQFTPIPNVVQNTQTDPMLQQQAISQQMAQQQAMMQQQMAQQQAMMQQTQQLSYYKDFFMKFANSQNFQQYVFSKGLQNFLSDPVVVAFGQTFVHNPDSNINNYVGQATQMGGQVLGQATQMGGQVLGQATQMGGQVLGQVGQVGGQLGGAAINVSGGVMSGVGNVLNSLFGGLSESLFGGNKKPTTPTPQQ